MKKKPDYKALYFAQKKLLRSQQAEHERTHNKMRKLESEAKMLRANYLGALADIDNLVGKLESHHLQFMKLLSKNYKLSHFKGEENE